MSAIEVKFSLADGQAITGEVFFSVSKYDKNNRKKHVKNKSMEFKKSTSEIIYETIADYTFDLFRVFDDKYKASPIKIQKLLFIAEMVSVYKYNESIFPDDVIFECNSCGFKIPTMTNYLNNHISNGELDNSAILLSSNERKEINELKKIYLIKDAVSEKQLDIICDTIIEFGKYYPIELGETLNRFKENSQNILFKQQPPFLFSILEFKTLLNNLEELGNKNKIANFILNYDKERDKNS